MCVWSTGELLVFQRKCFSISDNKITLSVKRRRSDLDVCIEANKKSSVINITWFSSRDREYRWNLSVLFVYIILDRDLIIYFLRQLWFMRRTTTNIDRYIYTDRKDEIYRLIKMSFYQIELISFDKTQPIYLTTSSSLWISQEYNMKVLISFFFNPRVLFDPFLLG